MKRASPATVSPVRNSRDRSSAEGSEDPTAESSVGSEAVSEPDQPFEEGVHDALDPDLRHRLISEAAFEMYTRRGFVDGFDVEDWLSAEAQVDHLLLNPQFSADRSDTQKA